MRSLFSVRDLPVSRGHLATVKSATIRRYLPKNKTKTHHHRGGALVLAELPFVVVFLLINLHIISLYLSQFVCLLLFGLCVGVSLLPTLDNYIYKSVEQNTQKQGKGGRLFFWSYLDILFGPQWCGNPKKWKGEWCDDFHDHTHTHIYIYTYIYIYTALSCANSFPGGASSQWSQVISCLLVLMMED